MEKTYSTLQMTQDSVCTPEKKGKKSRQKCSAGRTADCDSEDLTQSNVCKKTVPSQLGVRRSKRLSVSQHVVNERTSSDDETKKKRGLKLPSKRKGKLPEVAGEEEYYDSPRNKRTPGKSKLKDVKKGVDEEEPTEKKLRKTNSRNLQDKNSEKSEEKTLVTNSESKECLEEESEKAKKKSRISAKYLTIKGEKTGSTSVEMDINYTDDNFDASESSSVKKKSRKSRYLESMEAEEECESNVLNSANTSRKTISKSRTSLEGEQDNKSDNGILDVRGTKYEKASKSKNPISNFKSSNDGKIKLAPFDKGSDKFDHSFENLAPTSKKSRSVLVQNVPEESKLLESDISEDEISYNKTPKDKNSKKVSAIEKSKSYEEAGQEEEYMSHSKAKLKGKVLEKLGERGESEGKEQFVIKNSEVSVQGDDSKPRKKVCEAVRDTESEQEEMNEQVPSTKGSSKQLKEKAQRESLSFENKGESFKNKQNAVRQQVDTFVSPRRISREVPSELSTKMNQEFDCSISEGISLLKPKSFRVRRMDLWKVADDQGSGQEADSDAECRKAIMESAQRRIEQNLSTSESDSRLFRGLHTSSLARSSKDDTSDSGSAPEAVSFDSSRKQAADSMKDAKEAVKYEKQRLKERRKARLEMLKQQKEQKLIRLKEKMASQEDASCSSSEESGYEEELRNARLKMKKKKKVKPTVERTEKENVDEPAGASRPLDNTSDDTSEQEVLGSKEAMSLGSLKRLKEELYRKPVAIESVPSKVTNGALQDDKPKRKRKRKRGKKARGFNSLTSLDYIPLNVEGSTNFMVVPLKKTQSTSLSMGDVARKFRQQHLNSQITREAASNTLVRRKKRYSVKM